RAETGAHALSSLSDRTTSAPWNRVGRSSSGRLRTRARIRHHETVGAPAPGHLHNCHRKSAGRGPFVFSAVGTGPASSPHPGTSPCGEPGVDLSMSASLFVPWVWAQGFLPGVPEQFRPLMSWLFVFGEPMFTIPGLLGGLINWIKVVSLFCLLGWVVSWIA